MSSEHGQGPDDRGGPQAPAAGQAEPDGSDRADVYVSAMGPTRTGRPRAEHQLPPGRHKLSRSYVEDHQRRRILEAIVDVVSLAGYSEMSVEDVIGAAGVSRRTFYDQFKSKEDAFLCVIEAVSDELVECVQSAYEQADGFPAAIRDGLATFLQFLADEPRYADLLIVEVLAAGPVPIAGRNRIMDAFAAMVRKRAEGLAGERQPPELAAETIVGGIYEVVFSRILQGKARELPSLLPDLSYSLMQVYIGHDAAKREAVKPPAIAATSAAAA
jgi:AcrR family transcriptional regulator